MTLRKANQDIHLEPVLAYDRVAPIFAEISERRRAYLNAIEQIVIAEFPPGADSLLDIGAGNGARTLRIAAATGIAHAVLLEPSAAMRAQWPSEVRGWPIRAEDLHSKRGQFDGITCLWNVLGHIFPSDIRIEVLRQCARLLSPEGLLFVDVSHRYNARHYGPFVTALRMLRDRVLPNESNSDVTARWNVNGAAYSTAGHVFTHAEFCDTSQAAGLTIEKRFIVDYATGETCRSTFSGNLLYILRRASCTPA